MNKTILPHINRIAALLVASSLLALLGGLTGCATSSSVRIGNAYKPTPVSEIQILAEMPEEYEIVGLVEASAPRGYLRDPKSATNRAMEEIRKQAASLGAQAIVLEQISTDFVPDFSIGDSDDWGTIFTSERRNLTGKAIRIPQRERTGYSTRTE